MATTPQSRFEVKIGDRWFMTDLDLFERSPLKSISQTFDTGREPGEQSLGNEGIWKRSQFDWIHGAGQTFFDDDEENDRRRFEFSVGWDPWERSELSTLKETEVTLANAAADGNAAEMTVLGDRLFYAGSGGSLRRYNGSTWATPASPPTFPGTGFSLVALGQYLYISSGTTLKRCTTTSGCTTLGALTPDFLVAAADRLIGLEDNTIYEIDNAGAKVESANIYEHFDSTFDFKGGVYTPAGVYVFGDDGTRATVSMMVPIDSTTAFAPPYPVLELPPGELIRDMKYYGGIVILGTSLGFRLCQIGANGTLIFGPLREQGDVECLEVQKEYCWYGLSATPADPYGLFGSRSGLGRMGLDRFTAPLVPTYATDLLIQSGTQTIKACASYDGELLFAASDGSDIRIYRPHATNYVDQAIFGAGHINYGVPEQKALTSFEVRHQALAANESLNVDIWQDRDVAVVTDIGTSDTDGDALSRFIPSANLEAEIMYPTITAASTGNTQMKLYRWSLRSIPMVRRSERIRFGVMLYENVNGPNGYVQVRMDPQEQWEYLKSLETSRSLITVVMGDRSDTGYVDAVMLDQNQGESMVGDWDDNGFVNATWLVEILTNADA